MHKRIEYIDIARGMLIFLVVLGHSGFPSRYIYWFHMPAFFVLSGLVYKDIVSRADFVKYVLKRIHRLIFPYLYYFVLLSIFTFVFSIQRIDNIVTIVKSLAMGGAHLSGYYSIFWFITTYFLVQILFAFLQFLRLKKSGILVVLLASYLLAHYYVRFGNTYGITYDAWWSPRFIFTCLPYFGSGYFLKNIIMKIKPTRFLVLLTIEFAASLFILSELSILNYSLDLRSGFYNSYLWDFVIPVFFSFATIILSKVIFGTYIGNIFSYLGKRSMVIMYLHPIAATVTKFGDWYFYLLLGVCIPIIITKTLEYKGTIKNY